jgi:hypothetical protein
VDYNRTFSYELPTKIEFGVGSAQVWAVAFIVEAALISYLGAYGPLEKVQFGVVALLRPLPVVAAHGTVILPNQ